MKILCFIKNNYTFLIIVMIVQQEIFELYKICTFTICLAL